MRVGLWLQARQDAQAAVDLLSGELAAAGGARRQREEPELAGRLAEAYLFLGEACMAQPGHEDRDCLRAFEVSVDSLMHHADDHNTVTQPVRLQRAFSRSTGGGA